MADCQSMADSQPAELEADSDGGAAPELESPRRSGAS